MTLEEFRNSERGKISNDRYKKIFEEQDKNFKSLMEEDRQAKNNNKIVGRYLQFPYADGYAYYKITKENKKTVKIEVVTNIGDDWEIPYYGSIATIEKSTALNILNSRDRLNELFANKKRGL